MIVGWWRDRATREVEFDARLNAMPSIGVSASRLCRLPGTHQGKDERGVGYVKKIAIAGLEGSMRDVADKRLHGTIGEMLSEMGVGLARFPFVRDLDGFDFAAQPSIFPCNIRDLC